MMKKIFNKALNLIEKVGNALPHPATLFALFALMVILLSGVLSMFDIREIHPKTGEEITVINLMSEYGIHEILSGLVENFTGFAPLGTVLVAMLGIGIAEGSGLIGTALKVLVLKAPVRLLTFILVFSGILSNTASEVGYVLLIPLGAMIFEAAGKNPLAGMAATFAGVSGGYSANLLLGTIDPLLAGISEEAARIIDESYTVSPACNYYFMAASTAIIAFAGTWTTNVLVIPRLGQYKPDGTGQNNSNGLEKLTNEEKRGLKYAFYAGIITALVLVYSALPREYGLWGIGFLRNPENGELLHSPFMDGIVAIIFFAAAITGIAYGIGAKTIKSDADVMKGMGKSMETLGSYIVLVFFAAQFVEYFKDTNLGLIFAIKGAEFLKSSNLGTIPLIIVFILVASLINMLMGSASAKWAIIAPVFIPMFMLLGFTPEFTQVAYRIGDSVTNVISPMMSYFALIVAFVQRYDKKAGIGTLISMMIPYSVTFFISWVIMLVIWVLLDLPIGPGVEMML